MTGYDLPPAPTEPTGGRSCDAGGCDEPSIGWRWFAVPREWLPVCPGHGVVPRWRADWFVSDRETEDRGPL